MFYTNSSCYDGKDKYIYKKKTIDGVRKSRGRWDGKGE